MTFIIFVIWASYREKWWLYTSVGQPQKTKFLIVIEISILGWKSTTAKVDLQSNFKSEAGDTLKLFDLRATNIYVTL